MDTVMLILLGLSSFAVSDGTCSVLTPGEAEVVAETNKAREENGVEAVEVDCRLMASARRHARRLAREMNTQHSDARVAENVAAGPENSREAVVVWMRSPGHRANILNRGHRRIGVAGFIGPDGKAYWVQQFTP